MEEVKVYTGSYEFVDEKSIVILTDGNVLNLKEKSVKKWARSVFERKQEFIYYYKKYCRAVYDELNKECEFHQFHKDCKSDMKMKRDFFIQCGNCHFVVRYNDSVDPSIKKYAIMTADSNPYSKFRSVLEKVSNVSIVFYSKRYVFDKEYGQRYNPVKNELVDIFNPLCQVDINNKRKENGLNKIAVEKYEVSTKLFGCKTL